LLDELGPSPAPDTSTVSYPTVLARRVKETKQQKRLQQQATKAAPPTAAQIQKKRADFKSELKMNVGQGLHDSLLFREVVQEFVHASNFFPAQDNWHNYVSRRQTFDDLWIHTHMFGQYQ
jgi:hypothetical protein